jgi:hypothetical protein
MERMDGWAEFGAYVAAGPSMGVWFQVLRIYIRIK